MPKRTVKRFRYEAEMERKPMSPALERRIRKAALKRAPAELAAYESATEAIDRFYAVPGACMAAYLLGNPGLARQLARESLDLASMHSKDWNYGNAIHYGHTVLGLLAIQDDNLERAIAELHEAGNTPGSPQLNSFGPRMHLARELLRHGKYQAVLHYLQQCGQFWKMGSKWLSIWERKVGRCAMPTFFMQIYW